MARYLILLMDSLPPPFFRTLPTLPENPAARLFARTRELIDLDSTTGREREVGELLYNRLEELCRDVGTVEKISVDGERFNLFARWGEPRVVLSTHMDCVPPFFASEETEDEIRGRGACDAKGILASMIGAIEELLAAGRRDFGLLVVVAEETDSTGADAANRWIQESGLRPRHLINGEPTENRLSVGQKGSLKVVLECDGRAAHSAYPDEGRSALLPLLDTLERLRRLPLATDPMLGPSTLNIGVLDGGVAPNVIPPAARAELLVRLVGPSDQPRREIAACAAPGVRVTFPTELPYFKNTAPPPAGWETTVVSYASDLPFHAAWGQGFQLGPGTIRVAHTSDERIAKAELLEGARLYAKLARDLIRSTAR
jgi:acetylornithine deacetylase